MYTIDSIIPFDMVFDIDVGLIKLIREKYYDRNIFFPILGQASDNDLFYILKMRSTINPLYEFINQDKISDSEVENLYKEFIEKEYQRILELSTPTTLFNTIMMCFYNEPIKFTLWCRDEQEKHLFEKVGGKVNTIIVEHDPQKIDLSNIGNIYIKYYYQLFELYGTRIGGRNIYTVNAMYNLEKSPNDKYIPLIDISVKLSRTNEIYLADLHIIDESALING